MDVLIERGRCLDLVTHRCMKCECLVDELNNLIGKIILGKCNTFDKYTTNIGPDRCVQGEGGHAVSCFPWENPCLPCNNGTWVRYRLSACDFNSQGHSEGEPQLEQGGSTDWAAP